MRKPVNPVQEPDPPSTAITLVGTYELRTEQTSGPFMQFKGSLPAQYRVENASCFRRVPSYQNGMPNTEDRLIIRVRQLGEGAVEARFLVVWNEEGRIALPHIELSPHDPPDSAILQWSFWQGARVGGGLYHDVFDVTHFKELQLPAQR